MPLNIQAQIPDEALQILTIVNVAGNIVMYPSPNTSPEQVHSILATIIQEFASQATSVDLPPEPDGPDTAVATTLDTPTPPQETAVTLAPGETQTVTMPGGSTLTVSYPQAATPDEEGPPLENQGE